MYLGAIRGATAWEGQVGRVCIRISYPRFWRGRALDGSSNALFCLRRIFWIAPKDDA